MKLIVPNEANHRALWRWLAKHPDKGKSDWPGFQTITKLGLDRPQNLCFACEECRYCSDCPIDWHGSYCDDNGTVFSLWCDEKSEHEKSALAAQIAELPWRKV